MRSVLTIRVIAILVLASSAFAGVVKRDPAKVRQEYVQRMQQQAVPVSSDASMGSLWVTGGAMTNLQADYKASRVNDLVTIVVVQKTTAQASGNTNTQRDFNATSGITGLAGHISTSGVSNIFTGASSSKLKGAGSVDSSSTMKTNLTGQVIAVLPNGNLVVEAERLVTINNQKETMVVRGVLRPGDVGPDNSALSTSLSNLEVELRGKGVVTDATRGPNPLMRALLWIIGF